MKIFFLTYRLPYPPITGDRVRALQHIKLLSEDHDIFLLSLYRADKELKMIPELERYCKKVFPIKMNKISSIYGLLKALIVGEPLQCGYYGKSSAVIKTIRQVITQERIDVVYISLIRMAPYKLSDSNIPHILDYCDALSLQIKRRLNYGSVGYMRKPAYIMESKRLEKYEKNIKPLFEETLITSLEDARYIDASYPPVVIPNYYELKKDDDGITNKEPLTLAFTGDMAGVDSIIAIEYFCDEIFPNILKKQPATKLYIIGANVSDRIKNIADKYRSNTVVTGYVESIEMFLNRIQIYICPLKTGTGIKNRILQAMGAGIPIVSTPWGNKGIDAVPDRDILIADTADEFANKTLLLLRDSALRRRLSENAKEFVMKKFSHIVIKDLLTGTFKNIKDHTCQKQIDL